MKPQVISFHCVLQDKIGKIVSSTFNKDVITHGNSDYLQGLSEGLKDLKAGEKRRIVLSAPQAYGFYDLNLVVEISRKKLFKGKKLKVGDEIFIRTHDKKMRVCRVIQENSLNVTVDGNHPLAGQDLIFDVEGVHIRDATMEEVEELRTASLGSDYH